jgi:hypothetical protein
MNTRNLLGRAGLLAFCFVAAACVPALAQQPPDLSKSQMPSVITVPEAAKASGSFNVAAATDAYIAEIPASARARSEPPISRRLLADLWDL